MITQELIWKIVFVICVAALVGCGNETNLEKTPTVVQSLSPAPVQVLSTLTIPPPAIDPLPHSPYSMADITCYEMELVGNTTGYWVDQLIPGQSSIDDLAQVVDLSEEDPIAVGYWEYKKGDMRLRFQDGILIIRNDPRIKLSDIISQFGEPEHVVWHIPRKAYHLAKYDTLLLYPEASTVFYTEEQLTIFGPETLFEYSYVVQPMEFKELVSQYTSDENDDYQYFAWPCSN